MKSEWIQTYISEAIEFEVQAPQVKKMVNTTNSGEEIRLTDCKLFKVHTGEGLEELGRGMGDAESE